MRAITHADPALAYAGGVVAGGVGGARHGLTVGVGSGGLYILCSVVSRRSIDKNGGSVRLILCCGGGGGLVGL